MTVFLQLNWSSIFSNLGFAWIFFSVIKLVDHVVGNYPHFHKRESCLLEVDREYEMIVTPGNDSYMKWGLPSFCRLNKPQMAKTARVISITTTTKLIMISSQIVTCKKILIISTAFCCILGTILSIMILIRNYKTYIMGYLSAKRIL